MKQVLLMIAVVALVGCGKKASAQPSATPSHFEKTKAEAEEGDAKAQNNLGVMYAKGQGVDQDFKEAVKWYQKAADQGDAMAQTSCAVMYYKGEEVEQNYVTAYAWCNIAATNGGEVAKEDKSIFAKEMDPEQIAEAEELVKEMIKKNPKLLK